MKRPHFSVIAELYRYPEAGYLETVKKIEKDLAQSWPDVSKELHLFYEGMAQKDLDDQQALFTKTFDVQAITTLDIAYVLFGDDYKRGEILSHLNREHQKLNNDCGVELADHLPNLLVLLSKLEDEELVGELIHILLAPALRKMLAEFKPENLDKKNTLYKKHYKTLIESSVEDAMIYYHALAALYRMLMQEFRLQDEQVNDHENNDFLQSLTSELEIEKVAKE